jgi:hypothetical protein
MDAFYTLEKIWLFFTKKFKFLPLPVLFNIYSGHVKLLFGYFEKKVCEAFNILFDYAIISDLDL